MENSLIKFQNWLKEQNTDVFYLPSFDHYMSEYVPGRDSMRVFLSGFTGSVAEALVPSTGKIKLYVDGRYHEQADKECDPKLIEVVKVPFGESLLEVLKEDLKAFRNPSFAFERTQQSFIETLIKEGIVQKAIRLNEEDIKKVIGFQPAIFSGSLWEVPSYGSLNNKLNSLLQLGEVAFINALDTLAWSTGLRGHHLPYQGTFRGVALLKKGEVLIFVEDSNFDNAKGFQSDFRKIFKLSQLEQECQKLEDISKVYWDEYFTSAHFYEFIAGIFGSEKMEKHHGFYQWHAEKTQEEVEAFRRSFEKSDQAIFNGLSWLIQEGRAGKKVSELDFRDKVNQFYKEQGAKTQSFRTIAGFGSSSSIIHFGSPSDQKYYQEGEMVLLDSGAIYEEGYATDCTRTIIPVGNPTEDQKKQYTLVLKGLISLMRARVPKGILGKDLDLMARGPLKDNDMDYAHGTGHGVGVNVHEAGYSIRPNSLVPLKEGRVGSLEPGFYLPGVGGIRLENIVYVKEDTKDSQSLCFENFVYIGFWKPLIKESLLSREERDFLDEYERECAKRGRSFEGFFS